MSTPEQIVDGTQAEDTVSEQLGRVTNRLRKLPSKAGREGDHSPSVWVTFGECMATLAEVQEAVVELERELDEAEQELYDAHMSLAAVFSPDPAA